MQNNHLFCVCKVNSDEYSDKQFEDDLFINVIVCEAFFVETNLQFMLQ